MQKVKSFSLKLAVPALVFTGLLIPLGYQFIMILAGAGMTLEHRLNYGRWWDKGKLICHGRAGLLLLMASSAVAVVSFM